jgi:hypothetical protein
MVWYGMGTVLLSSLRLFFVSFRFVCDCFLCIPGVSSSCSSSTGCMYVCMYAVFGLCLCVLLFVLRVVLLACLSECRISKNHHS